LITAATKKDKKREKQKTFLQRRRVLVMYVCCWKKRFDRKHEERLALTAYCVCQCHKFWVQIFSVTLWSSDFWRPFRYFNGNARIDCCYMAITECDVCLCVWDHL